MQSWRVPSIRILIAIISLGLAVSSGQTIVTLLKQRGKVEVRKRELIQVSQENTRLETKLSEMSDASYVEQIARDQLGMIKEGETMLILPQTSKDKQAQITQTPVPYWRQWLILFF